MECLICRCLTDGGIVVYGGLRSSCTGCLVPDIGNIYLVWNNSALIRLPGMLRFQKRIEQITIEPPMSDLYSDLKIFQA